MGREEILGKLREILSTNFNVPAEKVKPEAAFRASFGLDSLDIVDLVFFLQKDFGYQAELDEYRELHTVQKLVDFVMTKQG
jgi:acyl carrier protein